MDAVIEFVCLRQIIKASFRCFGDTTAELFRRLATEGAEHPWRRGDALEVARRRAARLDLRELYVEDVRHFRLLSHS